MLFHAFVTSETLYRASFVLLFGEGRGLPVTVLKSARIVETFARQFGNYLQQQLCATALSSSCDVFPSIFLA